MNFGVIFLCLLFGCVIGYEAGSYMTRKRVSSILTKLGEDLQKTAEDAKKKREESEKKVAEITADILKHWKPITYADYWHKNDGDTDGDTILTERETK